MKRQIGNIAFGVAIIFSALAVPGYSDTILSFSGNLTGGSVSVNGSNVIDGLSDVPYNYLAVDVIGGPTTDYADLSATLTLSGNELVLSGEIPSLGIDSDITLVDITLPSSLTNLGTPTPLNVTFPNTTSATESALLASLGITGPVTSDLFGGGLIGDLTGSNSTDSFFDVTSDTLVISFASVPAPEPASLPLVGISLLGIALLYRRRLFQLQVTPRGR